MATTGARSLHAMASKQLIRNIDNLHDIGEMPYSRLHHVLIKINNPDQLEDLEHHCPQIVGKTGAIWLKFVKRDITDWGQKLQEPKNPAMWPTIYRKLAKDEALSQTAAEEVLKARMAGLLAQNKANTTVLTTDVIMPKRRHFTSSSSSGHSGWSSIAARVSKTSQSSRSPPGMTRTQKAISKIKRQAETYTRMMRDTPKNLAPRTPRFQPAMSDLRLHTGTATTSQIHVPKRKNDAVILPPAKRTR